MKIISKYKDYYDYLQGIYGVDEKLILDRTNFQNASYLKEYDKVILVIGEIVVEGIVIGGLVRYGEGIRKYAKKKETFQYRRKNQIHTFYDHNKFYSVSIPTGFGNRTETVTVLKEKVTRREYFRVYGISLSTKDVNLLKKFDSCPSFRYINNDNIIEYPILKDYNLASFVTPEEVWFKLSDWLSRDILIEDKRTNKEKIVSKGFDLKTSFRKM